MLSKHQLLTPTVLHLTFAPTANIFGNKHWSDEEGGDRGNSEEKQHLQYLMALSGHYILIQR